MPRIAGNLTRAANAASHQRCAVPLGIIALAVIIGFTMAGCDENGESGDPINSGNGSQTLDLTIAGTFPSITGGSSAAQFYAATAAPAALSMSRSAARNVTADDYKIEGYLKDGDSVFLVKGYYDTESNNYALSAASEDIRYMIYGEFNDDGTAETGKTIVQDKTGGDWETKNENVTVSETVFAFDVDGYLDDSENGIPANLRGVWLGEWEWGQKKGAIVTPFSVIILDEYEGVWSEGEVCSFASVVTEDGITMGVVGDIYDDTYQSFGRFALKLENGVLIFVKMHGWVDEEIDGTIYQIPETSRDTYAEAVEELIDAFWDQSYLPSNTSR